MHDQPSISVLMPCFDARDTIAESVESILAQTFADFELILFDDGSTDGTTEIALDYATKDDRIRVLRSEHVGIVPALQRLSREAKGHYLARMDADDLARPDRLALQFEFMEANPQLALCGSKVEIVGNGIASGRRRYEEWINGLLDHHAIARDIFVECPIPHPTFFMRRDAFEEVGGYRDKGWPEDYDLVMRLHAAEHRMAKVPETLLQWRHHDGRASMTDSGYTLERFRALKRNFLESLHLYHRPEFHQWGAGEVGKQWLKEWTTHRPVAVADIHPGKIGRVIHGVPVIEPEDLPPPGGGFTLVAVGAPGARDEIRTWFRDRDYCETRDYLFLA